MTAMRAPDWRFVFRHPAHAVAFGFGAGLSPVAPGTVGSLAALPLFLLLHPLLSSTAAWLIVLTVFYLVGVWACQTAGAAVGVADHHGIVWDEIVAMLLVWVFTPVTPLGFGVAFLLFRLFDVWKPFPIRAVDRNTRGGAGVMLDDLLAAGYVLLVMSGLRGIGVGI